VVRRSRFLLWVFLSFLVVLTVAYITRAAWLPWLTHPLIVDQTPFKADAVLVLGGDLEGMRILKAASLVRDGYAPYVLVSGPSLFNRHESDLAISYAIDRGYPAQWFVPLPHAALSTVEEARVVLPELRRRHVQRLLLVTSYFHTGRARRVFLAAERAAGGGPEIRAVGADDATFRRDDWWRRREGQKAALLEWTKTVAYALGL
jgi:uncharacterized SAM-binding protein YcdF (DUF218 family)